MADFQYTPSDGWNNTTEFPDYPSADQVRPLFQRLFDQIRDAFNGHKNDVVTDADGVHGLKIETGTWTPYILGSTTPGTNTYSVQTGKYTKINKRVFAECNIVMTAKDAAMAGSIRIGGLPFAANDNLNSLRFSSLSNVPLVANAYQISGYVSGSFGILLFFRNNLSQVALTPLEINNNTSMTVVMEYETA
jgi:hypothetical protein